MDIISLYYFSELAKDLHITKTAARLFISQQTLSNHLLRLENYYGTQLMYRKPALALTPAGEEVLEFAKSVSLEDLNLKDAISDITNQERGIIRFGGSPLRINACLPSILPEFSARYPHVKLRVTDEMSGRLEPMVLNNDLDFAAVLSAQENPMLSTLQLMLDPVYICIPDNLLKTYYGADSDALKHHALHNAEAADFAKLPFCLNTNRLGQRITECFLEKEAAPNVYITSSDTLLSLRLCMSGLAACFSTHMRLASQANELSDNINIFPLCLNGVPITQTLSLIYRRDRRFASYAQFFIDLLSRYFAKVESIHLERIV